MQIWIDTADIQTINTAQALGLLSGVTTNPTILSRVDTSPKDTIDRILLQHRAPIAVQITQQTEKTMFAQAKKLALYNNRIIVKIPATEVGFKVMANMAKEGLPFLATTILDVKQVYVASLLGAKFVSPYITSIYTLTGDYANALQKMQDILDKSNAKTKILAAHITEIDQIIYCAQLGIHAITLPAKMFSALIDTPPTAHDHLKKFADNWNNRDDELFKLSDPSNDHAKTGAILAE